MKRGQAVIILLIVIVAAVIALFVMFRGNITGGAVGRSINMPQTVPVQQVTVPAGSNVDSQRAQRYSQHATSPTFKTVFESCIVQRIPENNNCLNYCEVEKKECEKSPNADCKTGYNYCKIQCLDTLVYAVKEICIKGLGVLI